MGNLRIQERRCDLFPLTQQKKAIYPSTVKPRNQSQITCIPHETPLATISLLQSVIVLIYSNKVLYISFNRLAVSFSRDLIGMSNSYTQQMSLFYNTYGIFHLKDTSYETN